MEGTAVSVYQTKRITKRKANCYLVVFVVYNPLNFISACLLPKYYYREMNGRNASRDEAMTITSVKINTLETNAPNNLVTYYLSLLCIEHYSFL